MPELPTGRELRAEFLTATRARLMGPMEPEERLRERPDKRYLCGMLFPKGAKAVAAIADEAQDGNAEGADDEAELESPTDLLFQRLPASVGLTFAVDPDERELSIRAAAATYEREIPEDSGRQKRGLWARTAVAPETVAVRLADGIRPAQSVLGDLAELHVRTRLANGKRVVTVALVNRKVVDEESERIDPADVLYQVELACTPSRGIPAYPDPPRVGSDPEADELALQYRGRPTFAVGHGCAVQWNPPKAGRVASVEVDFVPAVEVTPVTTDISDLPEAAKAALPLQALQSQKFDPLPGLAALVDAYVRWHRGLVAVDVPPQFEISKAVMLARIEKVAQRMRAGLDRLRQADALQIFRLANRAMLLNMARQAAAKERKPDTPIRDPDPDRDDLSAFVWRPFQIAFFLLTVEGVWSEDSPDRNEVDLLWFPTGGGKTEAYLLLAAFEMIRRRVMLGAAGEGTAVIKRYTLRLLTIQQFERAGGLICALETMRRHKTLPGNSPFSLGLWVGEASSPNSHRDALADLDAILDTVGRVQGIRLPIKACPVCATPLIPESKELGSDKVGIRNNDGKTELFCVEKTCAFSEFLPIHFVDQALYEKPPTMLLGTLDKFAMLAWRDEARAFFGHGRNVRPPSLIVQDELHLISGPLGTVSGVYEAALDCAIRERGPAPKIVCATATIRRSADQIQRLFGRSGQTFPPPGLDASDSFFSRADSADRPGRLYVGAMGQGHTPTFSNVLAAAALFDAVNDLRVKYGEAVDTWWTLVSYHNSKRELGRALTLARDDIPARLAVLGSKRKISADNVEELSANLRDSQIPEMIQKLKVGLPSAATLDFVACTNMLSVGVDIDRLGLMLVSGQPKAVSEYIQASSRVGRSTNRPPGMVLALLSPTRPRDRSHYEFFRSFHESFYQHVEPTSVTPYALPSRDRALHGAFVALVRMASQYHDNKAAAKFEAAKVDLTALRDKLLRRIAAAEPQEAANARRDLDAFLGQWADAAREHGTKLRYAGRSKNYHSLLKAYYQEGSGRETLQSLRHVSPPLALKPPVLRPAVETSP
jgi:hypothetical protein